MVVWEEVCTYMKDAETWASEDRLEQYTSCKATKSPI